ncbi:hypothetical protein P691DRAFT_708219 [Macrolepiota fuliginosa MF-IS2]|uniref:CHAT domain-containing protein n=1 Tax=Macrolepiota fuliginosa MF-IS2 TaxID=1400762 RepID=A0A9P5X8S4_9AGAR|nr:hypothetical protein P691DRAFT_708219 [Macrolepiota fuliginosa MF-IS2]
MRAKILGGQVQRDHGQHHAYILNLPGIALNVMERLLSPPLAMLYRRMFEKWGRIDHLETSVHFSVLALSATPNDHPRLAHYQQRLAVSLRDRYKQRGRIWDLHLAISLQKSALTTVPPKDPDLAWHQQNLVVSYYALHSHSGRTEVLKTVLELQHCIFFALPDQDTHKAWWMHTIALTYHRLYANTGQPDHLDSGIYWGTMSLDNTPDTHDDVQSRRTALVGLLLDRAELRHNVDDIDRAILLTKGALEITPRGTIEHMTVTMSLALSYGSRYEILKRANDLDTALDLAVQVMTRFPRHHHYYPQFSHNTSQQFLKKYRRDEDIVDLEQALQYCRDAVGAASKKQPMLGLLKGLMATIYVDFYSRFGSVSDLEMAIDLNTSAINLLPEGHIKTPFHQLSLSILYFYQHRRHQDAQRLESAIHWGHLALGKAPKKSALRLDCLHNLVLLYQAKVQISRQIKDLDDAMSLMQEVIDSTPQHNPELPSRYSTMAHLHSTRYRYFGGPETRDTILTWMQAAVEAAERLKTPTLPAMQNSLALQFFNRYIWMREEADLHSSLQFALKSTKNTPDDHFSGAHRYTTLAEIYSQRFALDHGESVKKLALETYRHASTFTSSNLDAQWQLAQKWAMFSDSLPSPQESLDAYTYGFSILPALLWLGTNITTRHEALVKYDVALVASKAIVSCIENENYEAAIEFLEQSLSITFNQLLDLQTDLSLLEELHPDIAGKLRSISAELQQFAATTDEGGQEKADKASSQISDKLRKLALGRDVLLKEVRASPGFEHFLLPTPFSKIREVAAHGPVIAINCTDMRCDALIMITPNTPVLHRRLLKVNTKILYVQHQRLKKALEVLGIHARDLHEVRAGRVARQQRGPEHTMLDEVLQWLWTLVVSPVYDVLRNSEITEGRLWWCLTGPLTYFPLHAAGPPNKFIPSYTSTLNGLIRARTWQLKLATNSKVTVVGISESPDGSSAPLPSVVREVRVIKEGTPQPSILLNAEAVVSRVVSELPGSEWLHLACHGQQGGPKDPLSSCLLLYDGKLYLKQLLSMPLPHAEFVFLSACETAMGDTSMSNEALHLAGGMLFAGFKGAVATLWSINDDDGPAVAKAVYEHLFAADGQKTVADSAEALQKAVNRMRSMGVPAHRWVPFIHIGI